MPLGKSHRRPEKPLPNDSLKDGLYDQLLTSLTQGGEPIATKEEYSQWERENRNHPYGGDLFFENEAVPWPIRRRRALDIVELFTLDQWLRMTEIMHLKVDGTAILAKSRDHSKEAWEAREPVDVEQVRSLWLQWRGNVIRKYRLEGLVSQPDK